MLTPATPSNNASAVTTTPATNQAPATPSNNASAVTTTPGPTTAATTAMYIADIDPESQECLLTLPELESIEENKNFVDYVKSHLTWPKMFQKLPLAQSVAGAVAASPKADDLGFYPQAFMAGVGVAYTCSAAMDFNDISQALVTTQKIQIQFIRALAYLPRNAILSYSKMDDTGVVDAINPQAATLKGKEYLDASQALCEKIVAFLKANKSLVIKLRHNIEVVMGYTDNWSAGYQIGRFCAVAQNAAGGALTIMFYSSLAQGQAPSNPVSDGMRGLHIAMAAFPLAECYTKCIGKFVTRQQYLYTCMKLIIDRFYANNTHAIPFEVYSFLRPFITVEDYEKYAYTIQRHAVAQELKQLNSKADRTETQALTTTTTALAKKVSLVETGLTTANKSVADLSTATTTLKTTTQNLTEKVGKIEDKLADFEISVKEIAEDEVERLLGSQTPPLVFSSASSQSSSPSVGSSVSTKKANRMG